MVTAYLIGATSLPRRFRSYSGMPCQVNCRFQSKPPMLVALALPYWYLRVSSSITSMTGHTTLDLFSAMRSKRGSSHPTGTDDRSDCTHASRQTPVAGPRSPRATTSACVERDVRQCTLFFLHLVLPAFTSPSLHLWHAVPTQTRTHAWRSGAFVYVQPRHLCTTRTQTHTHTNKVMSQNSVYRSITSFVKGY